MPGILLLLPGDEGTIPTARELQAAGFTLSSAVASAGEEVERAPAGEAERAGQTGPEKRDRGPAGPVARQGMDAGTKAT